MVKTGAKGYRNEDKAVKFFRSLGYLAQRCTIRSRFGKKDIFNVGDVIIQNPKTGEILLVQVKSNNNSVPSECKEYTINNNCSMIFMNHVDRKGFKIKLITKGIVTSHIPSRINDINIDNQVVNPHFIPPKDKRVESPPVQLVRPRDG